MVGYAINKKLRTITATFLAGIFTLSIFSQLTAYAAGNLFKIKTAEITEISATAEGNITSYDDENIVSNIEFHQLNDEAKFKVILENTSAKDHIIETIEDDNTNPYIIYVYDNHAGETIAAGSELIFEFVAKYETQAAMDARTIASNVKFFIKYTEVEEPDEIELLVPNTGWGTVMGTESNRTVIRISTIATIFSGAALIVICVATIIRRKQSRNRRTVRSARRVVVVALTLAAITVSATVRAINVEMSSFTLTTNYTLKDRLQVTWTDAEGNDHEEIISYNEPVNIPEQTKDGHTLTGWEDENGNPVDPTQPFTDDTKIHPVFRAHKYTIKFNGNGATDGTMENLEMTFGEAKTLPANTFVWSGRTYTGWDTEANGSGAHYGDRDSVVDLTTEDNVIANLYAQWSINPFHIDYDGNEATSGKMATTNCEYDQECILRENAFARTGYDFKGWTYNGTDYADKADVTNIIENGTITMVAKWELHEYTITYLGLTDEEKATLRTQGNPDTYTILTPSFTLHNPEDRYDADGDKTQHFEGWRESTVSTTITLPQTDSLSNKIYEAIWSDVATPEYTVTYDYDGGDVATANKTKFTKFESFTLNEPVKEGYTFTGWTGTDVTAETKPYTVPTGVRHNLEFTAHYRKNTYSVAFDINTDDTNVSGSMSPMTGLEYDTNYNLTANAFARTGYTFGGWNTQADGQGNDYVDQGEFNNLTAEDGGTATLYAKWNPTQYTIIFHANNENVENPDAMAAQVVTYDVETPLSPIEYTWWQHKLVEWTTNANGTGTKYADKATIKNLNANGGEVHLYAKWREIDAALDGRGNLSNKNITTKLRAITIANPDAKNFLHYPNGEPSDEIKASATDLSGTIDPIYAWAEGENIYWWSEDVKPRISTNNSVEYHYYGVGKNTAEGKVNNLEYMDLTGFDTTGIVGARSPFEYTNIRRVDISDWDLSNATDMGYFAYNSQLTSIKFPEVFDVQKVTNVAMAFNGAKIVNLDLSSWKTRDLKNASSFINMSSVEEVKFSRDFSTANVTTMASMFAGSSKLSSLDLSMFNTANVQNMSGMFNSVSNMATLDISGFDTGAVTNMGNMFSNMSKLETLTVGSNFTAASVISMASIFANDTSLTSLDLSSWGATNSLTNLNRAFSGMTNLATLDLTGWDLSNVNNLDHTFHQTRNIETIYASSDTDSSKFTEDNLTWTYEYATPKIVGGAGSTGSHGMNGVHSRIDDPDNDKPGYFTPKNSIYIRYHDNDGDDTNDETNYALMPSYYVSTAEPYDIKLRTNAFEKEHYKFMGWATSADGEVVYADGAALEGVAASKNPLDLYAVWRERTAILGVGRNVNTALKAINSNATAFEHYSGTPNLTQIDYKVDIAAAASNFPVYAWTENDKIYWWSDAENVFMNENSGYMFNGTNFVSIDVSGFDASTAKDMSLMFIDTRNVENINITGWNTSNVTTMYAMFNRAGVNKEGPINVDLTELDVQNVLSFDQMFKETKFVTLDLSSWNVESVTNTRSMFSSMPNLTTLNISGFDLSGLGDTPIRLFQSNNPSVISNSLLTSPETITMDNVIFNKNMDSLFENQSKLTTLSINNIDTSRTTSMQSTFSGARNLAALDATQFNTANVTNMYRMFTNANAITSLDVSGWDVSKVTDMDHLFDMGNLTSIDLSTWNTQSLGVIKGLFDYARNLETIYVGENFNITNASVQNSSMFRENTKLVGGAGTAFNGQMTNSGKTHGRIDEPCDDRPGLFTLKNSQYICFYANNGTDDKTGQYLSTTESDKLKKNAFTRDGYVFTGWKDANNNEYTDEQVMADLVESKTPLELYAQWEKITATITFDKNTDDTTYGTMAAQTIVYDTPTALTANTFDRGYYVGNRFYSGQRYEFRGWNKAADGTDSHYDDEAVMEQEFTESTTLYAEWYDLCRTFETDSWSTIVSNIASDPMYYTPYGGCTKPVAIDMDGNGEDENYTVRLANTTTPEECAQSGYSQTGCGAVIEFVEDVDWRVVNSQNTNSGSWASTQLVSWLNSDFYNKLPADLQSFIIPTYPIVTGTGSDGTSSDITKYDVDKNKIYLYSPKEIGIDNANDNRRDVATDTRILDYYTKHYNTVALSRNSEVINKNSNQWFTRTPVASAGNFYHAIVSGATYSSNANVGRGIAPVFRIGTPPSCRDFATDSWSTIVSNLESDPDYYSSLLGCQKEVEMDIVGSDGKWGSDGVNESYTVMLTNTSTPEECATAGFSQTACGTVIEFVDKVTERRWTNKSGTNAVAGGWKASELAGWLNGDFYEKLPDDLKQVIIPSYIVSSNAGGLESPDITLGDANLNKIYLYSTKELGQPLTSTSNIEDNKIDSTRVADFYNIADNRSNYINRGSQLNNQWHSWWLRSSVLQRNNLPHDVQTVVTAGPGAENALGIFPVFRIGDQSSIISITFNANNSDVTGEMQPQIISNGNNISLALNTFERTYYNFLGWSTSADSSDVAYTDGADITGLSGNLELFAVWERMSEFDIAMFDAGKTRIEAADGKMYYQMQDMNSDICAAVPTAQDNNANEGRLVDNRDGKVYWVSKLKDEHCWMVQNLDHDIVTTPGYYTPDNTDITQDWTPTLATMNASSILSWDNTDVPHSLDPGDWYVTDTYTAIADDQEYDYIANGPNDYFKNTPFSGNGERGHVGNYYSWNAAMAMNSSNGSTMPAKTSICPKGWTVSHGNYAGLLNAYGVDTSNPAQSDQFLTGAPIYLTHAGAVTSTTTGSVDGRLWRSGAQGAYWAYLRDASGINYNVNPKGDILMTSPTGVTPSIWTARGAGWSVRCLAK